MGGGEEGMTLMKIAPYPLCWPSDWPRTEHEDRLAYLGGKAPPWNKIMARLHREMRLVDHGGLILSGGFVLSSDRPLRRDGLPYADPAAGEDPGAALYFQRDAKPVVLARDGYQRLGDNVRSLCLAVEALRQLERHGGDQITERAFQGFEALPAPVKKGGWWSTVLELDSGITMPLTLETAEASYRKLAKRFHPDQPGGSQVAMRRLNEAIEEARRNLA